MSGPIDLTPGPVQQGIDPRGPRFTAGVTAILLLVVIALALLLPTAWPAFALFAVLSALFALGAFAGIAHGPWSIVFRKLIRPRLKAPLELEDPTPPTFAQGVGFVITLAGLVLHLLGVPYAIVISASLAFVAAFLNSVFAYCLGCQIYLLLVRAGLLGRHRATAA
jgi:hypothetical protein